MNKKPVLFWLLPTVVVLSLAVLWAMRAGSHQPLRSEEGSVPVATTEGPTSGAAAAGKKGAADVAADFDGKNVGSGQAEGTMFGGSLNDVANSTRLLEPNASQPGESRGEDTSQLRGNAASEVGPAIGSPQASGANPYELNVPQGAQLPAVFHDNRSLPLPQRQALDRIANRFIDAAAADATGQNRELWEAARNKADREYIRLYGIDAYNKLQLQAAKEALLERPRPRPPGPTAP
jgi:hypothetical protein